MTERTEHLRCLAVTALCWVLCAAGTAAGTLIHCIDVRGTGEHHGGGLIASELVLVHPLCALAGTLTAAAVIAVLWFRGLRRSLLYFRGQHPLWYAAWGLLFAAGLILIFAAELMTYIWRAGLFIDPRPEWTLALLFLPPVLPAVLLAGYLLRLLRHRRNAV